MSPRFDVSTLEITQGGPGKSFVCCPSPQPVKGARYRFFGVIGPSEAHVRRSLDELLNGDSPEVSESLAHAAHAGSGRSCGESRS